MNHTEYLKIKDADTALAVRLAVTMGWEIHFSNVWNCVFIRDYGLHKVKHAYRWKEFNPFTDASIPYGLPVDISLQHCGWSAWCDGFNCSYQSKTHAIINAYCQADPMGHWAKFIGDKE